MKYLISLSFKNPEIQIVELLLRALTKIAYSDQFEELYSQQIDRIAAAPENRCTSAFF